jgi:hypothetical protein
MPAGYSKRSLPEKLGLKAGSKYILINEPPNYGEVLGELPPDLKRASSLKSPLDFIQFFTTERKELEKSILGLRRALVPNGVLWVSWPKGASKVKTDVNENVVREIALSNGLVDIKVCAVDEIWSGLKLVIPVKDR